jgi:hypothetical protein
MLTTRRRLVGLLVLALVWAAAPAAEAASGDCQQGNNPWCSASGSASGGSGGNGAGTGGGSGCTWGGQPFPCTDPEFGSYLGNGCYWKPVSTQAGMPPPAGHDPSKGVWGVKSCYTAPGSGAVMQTYWWRANAAPAVDPAVLARRALAKLQLLGAQIVVAPQPGGAGAVGLPVWLSTAVTDGTWGPQRASESEGGVTVTITARASRIVWSLGDGNSVTCANPGTAYEPRFGMAASPTCGYVYSTPSSTPAHPHGRYTITATTYWTVDWTGGGQSGVLTPTSRSATSVEIGEVQVVAQ